VTSSVIVFYSNPYNITTQLEEAGEKEKSEDVMNGLQELVYELRKRRGDTDNESHARNLCNVRANFEKYPAFYFFCPTIFPKFPAIKIRF